MVVALSGWVDAGLAGAGVVAVLGDQLESQRVFGTHRPRRPHGPPADPPDRAPRSTASPARSSGRRSTSSPATPGRDVVLCRGPSRRCAGGRCSARSSTSRRASASRRRSRSGGIPSMASHRRPVASWAPRPTRELVAEVGAWRQDYDGPTGAQSVLQVMLGEAGIPTVALWAQVPHYLSRARRRRRSAPCSAAARPRRPEPSTSPGSTSRPTRTSGGSRRARRPPRRRRGDRGDRASADATRRDRGRPAERRRARVRDRAVPARPVTRHARCRRAGGPGQGRPDRPTTVHSTPAAAMAEARRRQRVRSGVARSRRGPVELRRPAHLRPRSSR